LIIWATKSSESQKKKCISRGITLHTVVRHFQLWNFSVDLDMLNIFAVLITYIKGGTPAHIFLERGSSMTRATFVIFWPKLSSFVDWCCYTQVSYTGSQEPRKSTKKCISRGITLHTVVRHFQLWNIFVDLDMLNIFAA
jgi:hypothetical protein